MPVVSFVYLFPTGTNCTQRRFPHYVMEGDSTTFLADGGTNYGVRFHPLLSATSFLHNYRNGFPDLWIFCVDLLFCFDLNFYLMIFFFFLLSPETHVETTAGWQ